MSAKKSRKNLKCPSAKPEEVGFSSERLKINLKSALGKGDKEMAIKLWDALSASAKAELLAKPES
jgi:hypothetical protein